MNAVTQLLPRASTGAAGLDDVLGGGLARNRPHLLEGSPGARFSRSSITSTQHNSTVIMLDDLTAETIDASRLVWAKQKDRHVGE